MGYVNFPILYECSFSVSNFCHLYLGSLKYRQLTYYWSMLSYCILFSSFISLLYAPTLMNLIHLPKNVWQKCSSVCICMFYLEMVLYFISCFALYCFFSVSVFFWIFLPSTVPKTFVYNCIYDYFTASDCLHSVPQKAFSSFHLPTPLMMNN